MARRPRHHQDLCLNSSKTSFGWLIRVGWLGSFAEVQHVIQASFANPDVNLVFGTQHVYKKNGGDSAEIFQISLETSSKLT